ncbi:DUF4914 family protein [Crateriforma conspicua]|uniref:DUF4914 domain-containing protein n=1 Tax=Crateriforma conspicua TaxID=2527996 RepID=A0A5C5XRB6_9PLAN|nr:DUF4914 family protein [Crateriforma conspicua]QDV60923.1 hypothetical protein Mal65_00430 [Crateriforma conspicua]TWT65766.1 hypothetical protein Pan14r_53150 [Crateriforma conspicua]
MPLKELPELTLSQSAMSVLEAAEAENRLSLVGSVAELVEAAAPVDQRDAAGYYTVGYDIPGKGFIPEAKVCEVKNGIAANYLDPYMRRRDPNCMVIGDNRETDKPRYEDRFGEAFDGLRQETFEWLKTQPLSCFFFETGSKDDPIRAVAICPTNAAFFALGLAMLQGIVPLEKVRKAGSEYFHKAILYIAPPFRHTHFEGKQVVVHNRRFDDMGSDGNTTTLHELFSYNLYPGPSAKKGVYGMLLTAGERDEQPWTTAHCSTVQVITPYDNTTTIMHEGASGGGKSEMLEQMHRESDGRLKLATNLITGDERFLTIPRACELHPVTDDMALCHPDLKGPDERTRKVTLVDAEAAWFIRVNHITRYGTDPHLEALTTHPPGPILHLNIDTVPGSTALIWEHIQDEPGVPCPNPRVVMPREYYPNIVDAPVTVDIRSFGVRCPPCTIEKPTYGIMGLFHVLPPALAWLWRLVAPRGHGNPSIVDTGGMQSEGVGSYWPFATGRRVDQANILLDQITDTTDTMFVLIPNQHIGCWDVGFAPQWTVREYLARRGSSKFRDSELVEARCPLLGRHRHTMQVEGQIIGTWFFDVSKQPEVGETAYDAGAEILFDFFKTQLAKFDSPDLSANGRKIIDACLQGASVSDYDDMIKV